MSNKILYSILICFLIFVVFKVLQKISNQGHLKKNYALASGTISRFDVSFKSSACQIYYSFKFNNKSLLGSRSLGGINCGQNGDVFINKTFAVLVDTLNPANNAILITPDHFKKANRNFPDSLKWILKYYDDNFISF